MTSRRAPSLPLPFVALLRPARLGRALEAGGHVDPLHAIAAGQLVMPIYIASVFFMPILGLVLDELFGAAPRLAFEGAPAGLGGPDLPAPQAGLMALVAQGFIWPSPGEMAYRILTWMPAGIIGGLASGLVTYALFCRVVWLLFRGANATDRSRAVHGAGAMTWWLPVVAQVVSYSAGAVAYVGLNATGCACFVIAAFLGLWSVIGAGASGWSMLRHLSRARAAAGAVTLGALVVPISYVGMQIAVTSHFLWRELIVGR
jgi:hypothetical protein